jgi:very-short-patch-repair endonuclease
MTEHKHNEHPHPKWQPWNKGLTKETSELVKKQSETLNRRIASGEIKPSFLGRHWSEEHKKHLSEIRKQYLKLHPEKVPYVLNHSSKESFPERFFREAFTNEGFPKFTQDKYVNGYFLDFAFEGLNKYIEVDGEQHYLDKKIVEHDIIRQNNLANTKWQCVCRIRWSKFQKLSNEYKHRFLLGLKSKLIGK